MTGPDGDPNGDPNADPPGGAPPEEDPRTWARRQARRTIGFDEAVWNAVASEVRRLPEGVLRTSRDVPLVFGLSGLQIDRPVAASEARGLVDVHLAGLPAPRLLTSRPEVAWSLGPVLQESGFTQTTYVHMVRRADATATSSPIGFEVVDAAGYSPVQHALTGEQTWGSPEVCRAMDVRAARLQDRIGATFVVARDGTAACHVYRRGPIAQVDEVGVVTEARGRGVGTGLMAAALQACGDADTVFVIADADDWPRRWYGRLGFAEVATTWEWARRPDDTS